MAMTSHLRRRLPQRLVLALALSSTALVAVPLRAQDAEARLRKIETEVRALQRMVFPGGDGRYFTPEVTAPNSGQPTPGTPSASVTTDILGRLDAMEAQLADLTSQIELNSHALTLVQERLTALENARVALVAEAAPEDPAGFVPAISPGPAVQPAVQPQAPASTSFADGPAPVQPGATTRPAAVPPSVGTAAGARPAVVTPAPAPAIAPAAAVVRPAGVTPTPAPVQAPAPIAPSADRLAAVQAIAKPQTDDPGDDEYVYGFRLWEAKFYPEAQQQLRLFVGKYPNHKRLTFARNLLGRAYLDEGKPREAAPWFLENYQKDKNGERAPDSLLYLSETMIAVNDTNRACIALAEFADTYPAVATGRLAEQYNADRARVKCN